MSTLVELVPNVSEGRRAEVIEALARTLEAPPGIFLLDVSADRSHHRAVLTAVGEPRAVTAATLRLFEVATSSIDLRNHHGAHPRMGALDVLPFIPFRDCSMDDCVLLARRLAETVAERFDLPVYLYGEAAFRSHRRDLALIRRGEFEGLASKMQEPLWKPDFGPPTPHPTAGATAIGARELLIAFNVNLCTDRVEIAKAIAKAVRASSGGLPHVKALGLLMEESGQAQVSMNLTQYKTTSLETVFRVVEEEARRRGVAVADSEIVGLVPENGLPPSAEETLKLRDAASRRALEPMLRERMAERPAP